MAAIQYPFIDIAVHKDVRARFARGEALVLFSRDMTRVLWSNGAGADFFGNPSIYDFIDQGPNRQDVSFRQLEASAQQLHALGDSRGMLVRVSSGFRRVPVQATVEMVQVRAGDTAVLFSVPSEAGLDLAGRAARMLSGFDDPDTHMAMLDDEGNVVAASQHFAALGVTPHTARTLVNLVGATPERLLKRPIPTGRGYLPAAIGKVSDAPGLYLLFTVETILGDMSPNNGYEQMVPAEAAPAPAEEVAVPVVETAPVVQSPDASNGFAAVVDAIGDIEDIEDSHDDEGDAQAFDADAYISPVAPEAPDAPITDAAYPDAETSSFAPELPFQAENAGYDQPVMDGPAKPETVSSTDDETIAPEPSTDVTDGSPADEIPTTEDPHGENVAQAPAGMADIDVPQESYGEGVADWNAPADAPEVSEPQLETAEPAQEDDSLSAAEPVADAPAPVDEPAGFVFDRRGRPLRFVWKIDATGRFCEVSDEFAQAVGPRAADINGLAFGDVSALFNLDPEGKIGELLKKRDTWSGKTIFWPVEGTNLMVPVDLAALPTYSRNRDFDGFRGFGVVRSADAIEDPNATGMTFVAQPSVSSDTSPQVDDEAEAATSDTTETTHADLAEDVLPIEDAPQDTAEFVQEEPEPESDLFLPETQEPAETSSFVPGDEPPALRIIENEGRRLSDKIIQLEERRSRGKDGLTPYEQAAFREIARKLDPHGLRESADTAAQEAAPVREVENTPGEQDGDGAAVATLVSHVVKQDTDAASAENSDQPEPAAEPVVDEVPEDVPAPVRLPGDRVLSPEIVDMLPLALLVHRGDDLVHANAEFLQLTGYDSLQAVVDAGGLDALLERQDIDGATDHAGQVVVVRSDDELVPVSARLQSIRWEPDHASALMLALTPTATARPVARPVAQVVPVETNETSRELARLKVESEELRSILETATDGVVLLGAEGEIRSMNRSASALFNFDEEETRGKPFVMLFAHESQKAILDYLNGLTDNGVASVLNDGREVIGREASGGFLPLFMTIGRLTSSDGYCAVIRDITQWKRTEEELRSAKRAAETANAHKTDFLARVSHEIRTPLNAIIGFADMMASEHFGPIGHPRYVEYSGDIGRSGRHVLDIVNDLLDISKIEAGEMDLEFVSVGLNETVASAVSIVQPQANSQRVIIRTALSQSVPHVVADLRSIKQIVLNILANAIRFTPSGGQIIVSSAYEANGSVVLRIRDTGIGMSRTELEQAMKPFRQVATGGRSRSDGTGLGLPLTKAMVDANRATFSIHSTPNEGTLVEITFPSPRVLAN